MHFIKKINICFDRVSTIAKIEQNFGTFKGN